MIRPFLRQLFCASSLCAAQCLGFVSTGAFGVESPVDIVVDPTQQRSVGKVRPNIVFILADDLGYTDIAPYGSEVNTPSLSALAEQGLSFTNFHTAANCAPARALSQLFRTSEITGPKGLDGIYLAGYTCRPASFCGARSLTISLKQLVWALARAIVPESTRADACVQTLGSKKLTNLN